MGWAAVAFSTAPPRPKQPGWGLPWRRTGSSQDEPSELSSGSSSVSGSLQTQDGGRKTVIIPDPCQLPGPGIFSAATQCRVVAGGTPFCHLSSQEGTSTFPSSCSAPAPPLPFKNKFLFSLFWKSCPEDTKHLFCVPFPSSWSTFRNIAYLSGLRISHS